MRLYLIFLLPKSLLDIKKNLIKNGTRMLVQQNAYVYAKLWVWKIIEKMRKCEVTSFQKTSAARAFGKSGKVNPPLYLTYQTARCVAKNELIVSVWAKKYHIYAKLILFDFLSLGTEKSINGIEFPPPSWKKDVLSHRLGTLVFSKYHSRQSRHSRLSKTALTFGHQKTGTSSNLRSPA